jgi:hypothetical protein
MTSGDEEPELLREIFVMAIRRLEHGLEAAMAGSAVQTSDDRIGQLSNVLHDVGQDLLVIANVAAELHRSADAERPAASS